MDYRKAFEEEIRAFISPAVLFSGGLDSSLIAFFAIKPKL
jgi:asparagine synthetase B (glutamine-hydrolysing)